MEYIMRYPGAYFREALDYIESLYNNNKNIYPGSPLALAVFSGALQIIIKIKN